MSGRKSVFILLIVFLFIGCASVQYSEVQRNLREQKFGPAYEAITEAGPTDALGFALLAECRFYLMDYPGQAEASRKSLAVSDEFRPRIVRFLRLAYVEQLDKALRVYNADNYLESVKLFSEVIGFGKAIDKSMDPLIVQINQRVLSFSSDASMRLKNNSQAPAYLKGLGVEWREHPELLEQLAFVYYQLGDARACVAACESVLAFQPENMSVLKMRAQAAEGLGERDVALQAYQDLISHTPDSRIPQRNLGVLLYHLEDWHEARLHLESAIDWSDPDSLSLLRMVAECAYRDRDFPGATTYYQRISRSAPRDGDALRCMGACLWTLGKKDEARAAFDRAKQIAVADSTEKRGGSSK